MSSKAFETLNGFPAVLKNMRVVVSGKNVILPEEGLRMSVRMVQAVAQTGRKIMLVGNGGSAAIASHQAVDLWKNGGIRAIAFNDASLLTCLANDCGYENVFSKAVEMFGDAGDLLVAISSSGKSPNILGAVAAARRRGCQVITLSGFELGNPLSETGDVNFYIPSSRYGTVEVAHLLLVHAVIDEVIEQAARRRRDEEAASGRELGL